MPTSSGEVSLQDAIEAGTPFVDASGVKAHVYHKGSSCSERCSFVVCGLRARLDHLATEFYRLLDDFGGTDA